MDFTYDEVPCGLLTLSTKGIITDVNNTFAAMVGFSREKIIGRSMREFLTRPSHIYFQTFFAPMVSIYEKVEEFHLTLLSKSERRIPVLVNAAAGRSGVRCAVLQMSSREAYETEILHAKQDAEKILRDKDAAFVQLQQVMVEFEQKRRELTALNAELQEMTVTDPLTGIRNRRFAEQRLRRLLQAAEESGVPFSVLLLDIDHFKLVNDQFGHQTGDDVLKELGQFLTETVRGEDVVARLGGEEFLILLGSAEGESALAAAQRIVGQAAARRWKTVAVTISAGVASFQKGDTIKNIFSRADEALYQAKANGRNRAEASF
ncbi:sensor domain-containing diguanylate cyclase [Alkalicoccus urumqiensis]|uniref:GGDEF domain-containing protein n=1 Tax=Alkalicoccus urumqiensis TaxID=1548213 RepID=A0A2P6MJ20_ALKUR|nr:sensor domain-containing diguanylate cyclase [Alkalicoccus urumqiensis]PRO66277.1 GGDEF domain-containing protein [Alkalicoccus urumqiensis]